MAEILTNYVEPGFFTEVKVSPELYLNPGNAYVVGLIGKGTENATAAVRIGSTGGALDKFAFGSKSIWTLDQVLYDGYGIPYPSALYKVAYVGSVDLAAGGATDAKTIKIKVGADDITFTFAAALNTLAAIVAAINDNASPLKGKITALAAGNYLAFYSDAGASFTIGDGTANAVLGLTEGDNGNAIWFDRVADVDGILPAAGQVYDVTYSYKKTAADFKPKYFYNYNSVAFQYGDADLNNTLSMGAYVAFAGGASIVICRQLNPANMADAAALRGEISAALADLEGYDVDIIVPMDPISIDDNDVNKGVAYLNHVTKMSSKRERKERIAILSVDERGGFKDVMAADMQDAGDQSWQKLMEGFAAQGMAAKRIIVMHPGVSYVTIKGVQYESDGTYNAAVLAGTMVNASVDEATSMTRKSLVSVDKLVSPEQSRNLKNLLTTLGVTVIENKGGSIVVRRAVTADSSNIAAQEPSIVRAFDRVARELREGLENRYVGTKIIPGSTKASLQASTAVYLERLVASDIIGGYRNVLATQNPQEPRQFDITFEAIPVYPFLWGSIDISIVIG